MEDADSSDPDSDSESSGCTIRQAPKAIVPAYTGPRTHPYTRPTSAPPSFDYCAWGVSSITPMSMSATADAATGLTTGINVYFPTGVKKI